MELFRIILSSILILLAIYIIIMNWITYVFYKGKKNISGTPFFGAILLIVSFISATPLLKNTINKIKNTKYKIIIDILEPITYILLLVLTTSFLIDESFNPFLYFRF